MATASTKSSRRRAKVKRQQQELREEVVRSYQRNVIWDNLRKGLVWVILNARYSLIYGLGMGGRLSDLPEKNEKPLLAGLMLIYGCLMSMLLLFSLTSLFSFSVPIRVGVPALYILGSIALFLERPIATTLLGVALVFDLVFFTQSLLLQIVNIILFAFFCLVCLKDWRLILSLPGEKSASSETEKDDI
jgi:hypothetical protein